MSHAVVAGCAACAGSFLAVPCPRPLALLLVAFAAIGRTRLLLFVAMMAVTGSLSTAALAGLDDPPSGRVEGAARLVGDPERRGAAVRVDVRLDGRRYEVHAFGSLGGRLATASMGDVVDLVADVRPPRPGDDEWYRPRHIVAGATARSITDHRRPGGVFAVAGSVRQALERGSTSMDPDSRALFLGLVVGDDRGQREETRDRFRQAGLTHLLAVSGQNVAFLLAAAGPLLRRLPMYTRFVTAVLLIVVFVVVTRAEPSVMRAATMAGLALAARVTGRPLRSLDAVAWAVTGLVIVDPLLVWSVGFRLSVLATMGIVVLQAPIERRLVGPGWLTLPLSVTIAAQAAVTPLLVSTFGGVSLSTVPANLLAGPAAGGVMVWGSTAGLVAGWLPEGLAALIHLPTRVMLTWIDQVSRWAGTWPLPELG